MSSSSESESPKPSLPRRPSIWQAIRSYQPTEAEKPVLRECAKEAMFRGTAAAAVGIGATLLFVSRFHPTLFQRVFTAGGVGLIAGYVGASSVARSCGERLLRLDPSESPLKVALTEQLVRWNPGLAEQLEKEKARMSLQLAQQQQQK